MTDILSIIAKDLKHIIQTQPLNSILPTNNNFQALLDLKSNTTYSPDYFKLNSLGSTRTKKLLNNVTAIISPKLWKKTIWKKIISSTITELDHFLTFHTDNFFNTDTTTQDTQTPSFNPKNLTKEDIKRCHAQFLITLENELNTLPYSIRNKTFLEYFYTISATLEFFYTQTIHLSDFNKTHQNQSCLAIYNEIRSEVIAHPKGLEIATILATQTNWLDDTVTREHSLFMRLYDEINTLLDTNNYITELQLNHTLQLSKYTKQIRSNSNQKILYCVDNNGEIILDLLVIELLLNKGHHVTIATKSKPLLNDVTKSDLETLLTHDSLTHLNTYINSSQLTIITSSDTVPGQCIPYLSKKFLSAYTQTDLVMLKGQANFHCFPLYTQHLFKNNKPVKYKKPLLFMMILKSESTLNCIKSLFPNDPALGLNLPIIFYQEIEKELDEGH